MKSLLLAAAMILASGPALARTEREDAVDVLRVVIQAEAEGLRSWSSGPAACASPVIAESTFDDRRRAAQPASGSESADPAQRPIPRVRFLMRRQPGGPEGPMTEPEAREARDLADAVEAIVAGERKAPLVTRLESAWMIPPFRLCDEKRLGLLQLTSPVISGDLAFVSAEFDCALCGHGIDFALRRRGKAWVIVGENMRWVS